jgi:tRNA wybutosine-synthesizing protein 3
MAEDDSDNTSGVVAGSGGGKGRGRWVLVSHDLVDPQDVIDLVSVSESVPTSTTRHPNPQPWILKFEPMLLHVAAASLKHGQLLLRIALDLGFRESGLVVTDKRVTVAVRCNSLALAVPIFFDSRIGQSPSFSRNTIVLSDNYLTSLVNECNRRLELNWDQMDRLYQSISNHLFELRDDCICITTTNNRGTTTTIPSLNLWNASAILDQSKEDGKECIWVMGGYGKGPEFVWSEKDATKVPSTTLSCERSKDLYCLTRNIRQDNTSRHQSGMWDVAWRRCRIEHPKDAVLKLSTSNTLAVNEWMNQCPDLQGNISCKLQPSGLIVFWGGRQSPVRPSPASNIYVLDTRKPHGKPAIAKTCSSDDYSTPSSRWGHSLIAISSDRAVLCGGCNEDDGALGDLWILHLRSHFSHGETCYFEWERSEANFPSPRFHFGSALLENDTIMILGGLNNTKAILDPFEDVSGVGTIKNADCAVLAFQICETSFSKRQESDINMTPKTIVNESKVQLRNRSHTIQTRCGFGVGVACCTLMSKHLLVVTGGVAPIDVGNNDDPIQTYWITYHHDKDYPSRSNITGILLERIPLVFHKTDENHGSGVDFGSLVHHCCLAVGDDNVSNNNEIMLVGGGVSSFAFGEKFAASHHICLDFINSSGSGVSSHNKTLERSPISPPTGGPPIKQTENNIRPKAKVIYVRPSDAKSVKTMLEDNHWLDKRFRMMKVDRLVKDVDEIAEAWIALPVVVPFDVLNITLSKPDGNYESTYAKEYILGDGEEDLPWSSSHIASVKNRPGRN